MQSAEDIEKEIKQKIEQLRKLKYDEEKQKERREEQELQEKKEGIFNAITAFLDTSHYVAAAHQKFFDAKTPLNRSILDEVGHSETTSHAIKTTDRKITDLVWKKFDLTNDFIATHHRLKRKRATQEEKTEVEMEKRELEAENAARKAQLGERMAGVKSKKGGQKSINLFDPGLLAKDYQKYPKEMAKLSYAATSSSSQPAPTPSQPSQKPVAMSDDPVKLLGKPEVPRYEEYLSEQVQNTVITQ